MEFRLGIVRSNQDLLELDRVWAAESSSVGQTEVDTMVQGEEVAGLRKVRL